jgi:regulatory protein
MHDEISEVRRRAGKLREIRTVGGRRFLVLKDTPADRFLESGRPIGVEEIEELETELALPAGMAYAYRLLAIRDRTEQEIRASLAGEGITAPQVVDEIINSLKRQGYLDDRRLASSYIRYTMEHRPSGPHLMRRKLKEAGVEESVIEDEIASALSSGYEARTAERLARDRLRGESDRKRGARRVHGFLSRRGFSSSVVNDVCARIVRGEIPGEDHEQ